MIFPSDKLPGFVHRRDEDTSGGSSSMDHLGLQALENFLELRPSLLPPRASIELTCKTQCETDHTQCIRHTCPPGKSDRWRTEDSSFAVKIVQPSFH